MTVDTRIEKRLIFSFLFVLLLIASFSAPWIQFPLSNTINGVEYLYVLESETQSIFFYVFLVIFGIAGYVFSEYRRVYRYNVFFIAMSLSLLLMIPAYLASRDSSFVMNHLQDTEDFRQIQRFFRTYFIPNKGSSIALLPADAFDSITNRLVSVFSMLSWGWFLGFICAFSLFIYSAFKANLVVVFLSAFIVLAPAGLIFGSTVLSMGYSFNAQRHLAQMDVTKSYSEMITAFRLDPLLKYSERSTYFFSKLSFQVYGDDSASSVLYRAKQLELGGKRKQSMQLLLDTLRDNDGEEYFAFVAVQAEKQLLGLIEKISRRYYREEFHDQASSLIAEGLEIFPRSRSLRMQNVYAYMQLNLAGSCLETVKSVMQEIDTPYLKADFLATLGECYLMDGQVSNARLAFQESLELDSTRNIRAIRGLSGS